MVSSTDWVLKFKVDGATKGKSRLKGSEVLLRNLKGQVLMFSKHVGVRARLDGTFWQCYQFRSVPTRTYRIWPELKQNTVPKNFGPNSGQFWLFRLILMGIGPFRSDNRNVWDPVKTAQPHKNRSIWSFFPPNSSNTPPIMAFPTAI